MDASTPHAPEPNKRTLATAMGGRQDAEKEQIKQLVPIEDVISETVLLKSAGTNRLRGLCPLHDEKTPSFDVRTDEQYFYCRGCSKGGDVFTFMELALGMDFATALETLAQRTGITLSRQKKGPPKKDFYEVNQLAQRHFQNSFKGSSAEEYMLGRGFKAETLETWGVGFASPSRRELVEFTRRESYSPTLVVRAGLATSKGEGYALDLFRNRVTVPITDLYGRVVGFSGRTLDGNSAKYLNTPETDIFKKSNILFGLDKAKSAIKTRRKAIGVEGHFDVLACHQEGFDSVVGLQGSKITEAQIRQLEWLGVTTLYLALDADPAGEGGTLGSLDAIRRCFDVRIVSFDEGKDPADTVLGNREAFQAALDAAQSEAEYRCRMALRDVDLRTKEGRDTFLQRLKPALGDLGLPGSGSELRELVALAVGADITTGDLKTFAEGKEPSIDAHLEVEDDARLRKELVRERVSGELQPFPLEVLPAPLREYVAVCAAALPAPPDFVAVPLLCVLATAIGHSRKIVIKESWHESARLWAAIVAAPGSRKSAGLAKANAPIHERQTRFKQAYDANLEVYGIELQDYEAAKARRKQGDPLPPHPGDEPTMQQVIVTDSTMEALTELHARNPRALLLHQDELSGWVGGMNQYKSAGGNDRQKWLSSWSGEPVHVNRKGKAAEMIAEPFINVVGGIQPDLLPTLLNRAGADGFLDRILLSYPKTVKAKPFNFEEDVTPEQAATFHRIVEKLFALEQVETADGPRAKPLQLTAEARHVFAEWMDAHSKEKEAPGLDLRLRGAWGKLEGYCARLALVLHLAAYVVGEEDSEMISELSVRKAADVIVYFKSHLRRCYQLMAPNAEDKTLFALYDYISQQPGRRCSPRDIARAQLSGCDLTKAVKAQLQKLTDAGLGELEAVRYPSGQKGEVYVLKAADKDVG